MEDYDQAVDLYKEFVKIAPHDLGRYVLKYKIYKGRGAAIEVIQSRYRGGVRTGISGAVGL